MTHDVDPSELILIQSSLNASYQTFKLHGRDDAAQFAAGFIRRLADHGSGPVPSEIMHHAVALAERARRFEPKEWR